MSNLLTVRIKNYSEYFIWAVYLLLCFVFYKERTLFLDNAFQTFLLIQDENIVVNANRWPVVILRVLPLLCVKMGLSLKTILLSFSLSYFLAHFGLYWIIRKLLGDRKNAFLLLMLLVIPVTHSFYWNNSELIIGLSMLFFWLSLFDKRKVIWLSILTLVLPWVHPLILLLFLFISCFLFFNKTTNRILAVIQGALFLIMTSIKVGFFPNWYDNIKHANFMENLEKFQFTNSQFLSSILEWNYVPIIFGVLTTMILCVVNKKYIQCLLFIVFVFFYLLINDISITDYSHSFYHEVSFLAIFFACLFVGSRVLKKDQLELMLLVLVLGIIIGFIRTGIKSSFYKERINWFVEQSESQDRTINQFKEEHKDILVIPWATSYESLIISSMQGQSKTFRYVNNINDLDISDSATQIFMEYKDYQNHELNQRYFQVIPKSYTINN